jgi:tripartite-type tricarboxylate transporter receptor subunit TctC
MFDRRGFLSGGIAAAILVSPARAAYPDRPIKIIVPGSPGGPTDVMARLVSQRLQQMLGQTVVVENRAGGGGSVAAKVVASAEPDGHTLLFCNTSIMATIPAVAKRPEYNPVKDFAPVAKVSQSEQLLVLHPDVPPNTVMEFVTYCKANPGKLNCAATGYGGLPHCTLALSPIRDTHSEGFSYFVTSIAAPVASKEKTRICKVPEGECPSTPGAPLLERH